MRKTLLEAPLDVLVVDRRPASLEELLAAVRRGADLVEGVVDADDAARLAADRRPGVVLVDAALARADDWTLVARLREAEAASLVIAVGQEDDALKIEALERGCDDYLARSATPQEVSARIRASLRLLRRLGGQHRNEVYDDGLVRIDAALRTVEVEGAPLALTPLEFRLLIALVRGRDRVVSREELFETTWHGAPPVDGDHVKLYVHYLRRKLHEHTNAELIQTVRGFGYRWLGARALERTGRFARPGAG